MKFKILAAVAATMVLASGTMAQAAEVVVTQKAKKFDQKKVEISKGDSIKFVNADSIAHNIHASGAGKFDLGVQKPGAASSQAFAAAGNYKIRCAIHPKMKLKVTVK
ncbi:MAG: cupredoxin domain-containing protein [Alphaproteobacteria bacterium]